MRLVEISTRTPILLATGGLTIVLLFFVFPNLPLPVSSLDASFGYTYEQAIAVLTEYGEEGRVLYVWMSLSLDTLLPVAYTSFLVGLIKRLQTFTWMSWFIVLPILSGCLDILENVQLIVMMFQYPEISEIQVNVASTITQLKFLAFHVSLLSVLLLLSIYVVRYFRNRSSSD